MLLQVVNRVVQPFQVASASGAAIKRPQNPDQNIPPPKQPKVLNKLDEIDLQNLSVKKMFEAQNLLIQYLKSQVHKKLPDKVKEAIEVLKNSNFEINEDENIEAVTFTHRYCNLEQEIYWVLFLENRHFFMNILLKRFTYLFEKIGLIHKEVEFHNFCTNNCSLSI